MTNDEEPPATPDELEDNIKRDKRLGEIIDPAREEEEEECDEGD